MEDVEREAKEGTGLRWRRLALAVTAGLVGLYALLGYWVIPEVGRSLAVSTVAESSGHELVIEDVSLDPFAFTLELRGVALRTPQGGSLLELERLFADLDTSSLWSGVVHLREVSLQRPLVQLDIDESGRMGWLEFVEAMTAADPEAPPEPEPAEPGQPLRIELELVQISGGDIRLRDRSQEPALELDIEPIDLRLRDLSLGSRPQPADIGVEIGLAGGGTLQITGQLSPAPTADIEIALVGLELVQFQPLIAQALNAKLEEGRLGATAQVHYDGEAEPALTVAAGLILDSLLLRDPDGTPIVRLGGLDVSELEVRNAPLEVHMATLSLREPELRVALGPDGRLNLASLARAPAEEAGAEAAEALPEAEPAPAPVVSIGHVDLRGGTLHFEDASVEGPFRFVLQSLEGEADGISTRADARVKARLAGETAQHGPFELAAEVSPLADDPDLDLDLSLRNYALAPVSPYSARYAGYEIASGSLDLALDYRLQRTHLVGDNDLVFHDLGLGAKVDSPQAPNVPLPLGLALLKDSQGVVDLDLEIEGDVSDPGFNVGEVLLGTLMNVFRKAATKPFQLLGSLVPGSGAPPDQVSFEPGDAQLDGAQASALRSLAEAMKKKEELRLRVEGGASAEVDGPLLARRRLDARLRELRGGDPERPLSSEDREKLLVRLYRDTFDTRQVDVAAAPEDGGEDEEERRLAAMEARLLERQELPSDALPDLADARATRIREYLLDVGELPPERVQLAAPAFAEEGRVPTRLMLELP